MRADDVTSGLSTQGSEENKAPEAQAVQLLRRLV